MGYFSYQKKRKGDAQLVHIHVRKFWIQPFYGDWTETRKSRQATAVREGPQVKQGATRDTQRSPQLGT